MGVGANGVSVTTRQGACLVQPVDLVWSPGLHAVMGPSGAGKTQLTMALCGISPHTVRGTVSSQSAGTFVATHQPFPLDLTVNEVLDLYARLQNLPISRCHELAENMGLQSRTTRMGAVSTGEYKRVQLVVEMMVSTTFVVLDEPTSGLSDTDALALMSHIATSRPHNAVYLVVIHQPRQEIVSLFDTFTFMTHGGSVVLHGPLATIAPSFDVNPEQPNAVVLLMDAVSADGVRPVLCVADGVPRVERTLNALPVTPPSVCRQLGALRAPCWRLYRKQWVVLALIAVQHIFTALVVKWTNDLAVEFANEFAAVVYISSVTNVWLHCNYRLSYRDRVPLWCHTLVRGWSTPLGLTIHRLLWNVGMACVVSPFVVGVGHAILGVPCTMSAYSVHLTMPFVAVLLESNVLFQQMLSEEYLTAAANTCLGIWTSGSGVFTSYNEMGAIGRAIATVNPVFYLLNGWLSQSPEGLTDSPFGLAPAGVCAVLWAMVGALAVLRWGVWCRCGT